MAFNYVKLVFKVLSFIIITYKIIEFTSVTIFKILAFNFSLSILNTLKNVFTKLIIVQCGISN